MAIKKAAFQKYARLQKESPKPNLKSLTDISIEHKDTQPKTNLRQTNTKPRTEPKTNLRQTNTKPRTEHRTEHRTEPETNLGQTEDKPRTNLRQTNTNPRTEPRTTYNSISLTKNSFHAQSGLSRKIAIYMYELCVSSRSKMTPKLSSESIANTCLTSISSVRKTIQRMIKNNIIARIEFKDGRNGWTIYQLNNNIYQEILQEKSLLSSNNESFNLGQTEDKPRTNLGQTEDKLRTEPRTEPRTEFPSSSTNITNINTTTGLDENYSQVQIPKILKENNFSVNIIKQVQDRGYLSVNDLQSSLEAFAFDVTTNKVLEKKKVNNAVAYFMGIVKNKIPYAAPSNFESDEDKAFKEQEIRLQAIKQKRLDREKIIEELAFEEWLDGLTTSEKIKLAPPVSAKNGVGSFIHNSQLRGVWNKQQQELLKKN